MRDRKILIERVRHKHREEESNIETKENIEIHM